MNLIENAELEYKNTLGLKSLSRYFVNVSTLTDLQAALVFAREKQLPVIPLGGGSNMVISGNLNAVVVEIGLKGRSVLSSDGKKILVEVGAGEIWSDFVKWSIAQGAYGLENLSLIPGLVGAAPIQNIGAYGVELENSFHSLSAVDVFSGEIRQILRKDCQFSYRSSIFKGKLKDRYIITSVQFKLDKKLKPRLSYEGLHQQVEDKASGGELSASLISDVVCDIRHKKLPDPAILCNVGSFFKNPIVSLGDFTKLKQKYPDIVAFSTDNKKYKLAAGWLIEKIGLKGVREGAVGTHKKQALVIVNYGGASGADVMCFSAMIQQKVYDFFGVKLKLEPRVY